MRRTLVSIALALAVASCASHPTTAPPASRVVDIPRPNSPANSTRAVLDCWRLQVATQFDSLMTDDFQFVFAPSDTAANAYRARPWTREDELASAYHMLAGGGSRPPIRDIQVVFDTNLVALPDPRPGKDPTWHKLIRTRVDVTASEEWDGMGRVRTITGYAQFYLVRGDSASIPADLVQRGWGPDPSRWWLQRWDDETLPNGVAGAHPSPATQTSWGQLKADYR
jgi:hypothetical protein